MKLDRQQKWQQARPIPFQFHAFNDAVRAGSSHLQRRRHARDSLVMSAINAQRLPAGYLGQERSLCQSHIMHHLAALGHLPMIESFGSFQANISNQRAAQGYTDFDKGVAKKFVLDPHGLLGTTA